MSKGRLRPVFSIKMKTNLSMVIELPPLHENNGGKK